MARCLRTCCSRREYVLSLNVFVSHCGSQGRTGRTQPFSIIIKLGCNCIIIQVAVHSINDLYCRLLLLLFS